MILNALSDLYYQLVTKGVLAEPGWTPFKVAIGISLDETGQTRKLIPLKVEEKEEKKTVLASQPLNVPTAVKRSVEISSNFLYDNANYIVGISQ